MNLLDYKKKRKDKSVRKFKKKKLSCLWCGKFISYEKRNNKFCNSLCVAKYNNPIRISRKRIRYCLYCGKEIVKYGNEYCNPGCFQALQWENYKKVVLEKREFPGRDGNFGCDRPKKFLIDMRT